MAFDRHMNLVLGDTEEYRKVKAKKGTQVITLTAGRSAPLICRYASRILHVLHVLGFRIPSTCLIAGSDPCPDPAS
eukprot:52276-Eustigmatos_ZCMA.PRE.1